MTVYKMKTKEETGDCVVSVSLQGDKEKRNVKSGKTTTSWILIISIILLIIASALLLLNYFHFSSTQNLNFIISVFELKKRLGQLTLSQTQPTKPQCDFTSKENHFDCWPEFQGATEEKCVARGCCWHPGAGAAYGMPRDAPYCFFPKNYPGYTTGTVSQTAYGVSAKLTRSSKTPWSEDIKELQMDVYFETDNRLHFKIYDPNNKRYEVPVEVPHVTKKASNPTYDVKFLSGDFNIAVTRKGSGETLFDTTGVIPMVFSDQYLQIGSKLSSRYIYGLGEHRGRFLHNTTWTKLTFWARDEPPRENVNLYGDHPIYLNLEKDGNAHGVFLLNSNTMETDLQDFPAITYRTIGGILDFYVFAGPTADAVIAQYNDVIGKPFMPPYWALGFHLCRWGWGGGDGMKKVIQRNRDAKMPLDTMWNDIDYMREHLDFTLDTKSYGELPKIVDDLHDNNQRYIMIVDPGISNVQSAGSYPPYDKGLAEGVFMMTADGSKPIIGKVWPGNTAFPDFFNPKTIDYWYDQANGYYQTVKFDGMWIDMNEPSNFVDGSLDGCTKNKYDNPPFIPPGLGGASLQSKTLCASALQNISVHYNLHNLYGHSEAIASNMALTKIHNKRTIVISRSSFPSTGRYSGHWLGDNNAQWPDVGYSISGILNFNMFGIPLVGPDICGFNGDTNPELCTRWMQLGAFYPFMRNHNTKGNADQDPASFDSTTQDIMRTALMMRYLYLPYLYTLFYRSSSTGSPIIRALFYQYPTNTDLYAIDDQFMWGDALLITPIIQQGAVSRRGYLPQDTWYDTYNGTQATASGFVQFSIPLDRIGVHIRGGSIIPLMQPNITTQDQRNSGTFELVVALNSNGEADGQLFWDDGVELDTVKNGHYNLIGFKASKSSMASTLSHVGYTPSVKMNLFQVVVLGVANEPGAVTANGKNVPFNYMKDSKSLLITSLSLDLLKTFQISWS